MFAFLLAAVVSSQSPDSRITAWDSPEFVKALEQDRAKSDTETVNMLVISRLAGAAWYVCALDQEKRDEWAKRNSLTDAEDLLLESHCFTYWFARRDLEQQMKASTK